jgi:hypothetical protein
LIASDREDRELVDESVLPDWDACKPGRLESRDRRRPRKKKVKKRAVTSFFSQSWEEEDERWDKINYDVGGGTNIGHT